MSIQLGAVQTVVVCRPGSDGVRGACPVDQVESLTQAYMIAPSQAAFLEHSAEPFDPATAGMYFGFSLASTIALWALSHGIGQVIKLVKNG